MFGQYYTPVEAKQLNDGFYHAIIRNVETQTNSIGEYLVVTVEIKEHKDATPNKVFLNDMPTSSYGSYTLEECQDMWKRNMTRFFQNFDIEYHGINPFGNIKSWIGHTGEVTVRPQKNSNYKDLVLYHWEQKKTENNQPSSVQTVATVFNGNVQPQGIAPNMGFPEDIPSGF